MPTLPEDASRDEPILRILRVAHHAPRACTEGGRNPDAGNATHQARCEAAAKALDAADASGGSCRAASSCGCGPAGCTATAGATDGGTGCSTAATRTQGRAATATTPSTTCRSAGA